jgi:hypothetical protein
MFPCYLFLHGVLYPFGEHTVWSRFTLGGSLDYYFSSGLFLLHLPTIPPRLFPSCRYPGLQKLGLSI